MIKSNIESSAEQFNSQRYHKSLGLTPPRAYLKKHCNIWDETLFCYPIQDYPCPVTGERSKSADCLINSLHLSFTKLQRSFPESRCQLRPNKSSQMPNCVFQHRPLGMIVTFGITGHRRSIPNKNRPKNCGTDL